MLATTKDTVVLATNKETSLLLAVSKYKIKTDLVYTRAVRNSSVLQYHDILRTKMRMDKV